MTGDSADFKIFLVSLNFTIEFKYFAATNKILAKTIFDKRSHIPRYITVDCIEFLFTF